MKTATKYGDGSLARTDPRLVYQNIVLSQSGHHSRIGKMLEPRDRAGCFAGNSIAIVFVSFQSTRTQKMAKWKLH